MAFRIYEEFILFQSDKTRPKFFEFCKLISKEASEYNIGRIGIFFATEWYAKDRIRMSYGNISRLIFILSLPGHWTVNTLNPRTGKMEEWDELPFYYELEIQKMQLI